MSKVENWKQIPGYRDYYEVSDLGRVRSLDRTATDGRFYAGRLLTAYVNAYGYPVVVLSSPNGSKRKWLPVHKLVMLAFKGERAEGTEVCHHNGVRTDARLVNLRYDTRKANVADARRHGTLRTGEQNNFTRYSDAIIADIRAFSGPISEIISTYGMSRMQVWRVRNFKARG